MSDDAALRERTLRLLGVLDKRHTPGGHPHNQDSHGNGGFGQGKGKGKGSLASWFSKVKPDKKADQTAEPTAEKPQNPVKQADPRIVEKRRRFAGRASEAATGPKALAATPAKFSFDIKENSDGTFSYRGTGKVQGPKGVGSAAALEAYVSTDDYETINRFSRGLMPGQSGPGEMPESDPSGGAARIADQVGEIDKTMKVSRLEEDIVVHRAVRSGAELFGTIFSTGEDIGNDFEKLRRIQRKRATGWRPDVTGLTFTDHGFNSTSADDAWVKKWARQWDAPGDEPVLMRMLVRKGTGAVQMSGEESGEKEILLERGLSWEIVEDHGVDEDGLRHLDLMPVAR